MSTDEKTADGSAFLDGLRSTSDVIQRYFDKLLRDKKLSASVDTLVSVYYIGAASSTEEPDTAAASTAATLVAFVLGWAYGKNDEALLDILNNEEFMSYARRFVKEVLRSKAEADLSVILPEAPNVLH